MNGVSELEWLRTVQLRQLHWLCYCKSSFYNFFYIHRRLIHYCQHLSRFASFGPWSPLPNATTPFIACDHLLFACFRRSRRPSFALQTPTMSLCTFTCSLCPQSASLQPSSHPSHTFPHTDLPSNLGSRTRPSHVLPSPPPQP